MADVLKRSLSLTRGQSDNLFQCLDVVTKRSERVSYQFLQTKFCWNPANTVRHMFWVRSDMLDLWHKRSDGVYRSAISQFAHLPVGGSGCVGERLWEDGLQKDTLPNIIIVEKMKEFLLKMPLIAAEPHLHYYRMWGSGDVTFISIVQSNENILSSDAQQDLWLLLDLSSKSANQGC